ncbi:hypothetical protein GGS20DRAFT_560347 [Poronia punctata]|nr:hypothetical protein GGS20DRAFT_560347 [Poronia punctata]
MKWAAPTLVLSFAGGALAQCGVDGETIEVNYDSPTILEDINPCDIIYGDLHVAPGWVYFDLPHPVEFTGTIILDRNEILKWFNVDSAEKMGGLRILSPPWIGQMNLPKLTEIGLLEWRNITWADQDDGFSWLANELVHISNLVVEETFLSGFTKVISPYGWEWYNGLEALQTADEIRVVNNPRMGHILFPSLKSVSGTLNLGNNRGHPAMSFPALESVGAVDIFDKDITRGIHSGVLDFPVLTHVSGDFKFTGLYGTKSIVAPGLTDVEGGVYITGNKFLEEVDLSNLKSTSEIVVEGTPGGDPNARGISHLNFPSLERVDKFRISLDSYGFTCNQVEWIKDIANDYYCFDGRSGNGGATGTGTGTVPGTKPPVTYSSQPGYTSFPPVPTTTSDLPAFSSSSSFSPSSPLATVTTTKGPGGHPTVTPVPTTTESGDVPPASSSAPATSTPATAGASRMNSPFGFIFSIVKRWI